MKDEPKEEDNSQKSKKESKYRLNKKQRKFSKSLYVRIAIKDTRNSVDLIKDQSSVTSAKETGHHSHESRDIKTAVYSGCGEQGRIRTRFHKAAREGTAKPGKAKGRNA